MANEELVAKLKEGFGAWSDWLRVNPDVRPNLIRADLSGADLSNADLRDAILSNADLSDAILSGASLSNADLSDASLGYTVFAFVNLSTVRGLATCNHNGPSELGSYTLAHSGLLPLVFQRGCGLPDVMIDYLPSMFGEAIQFHSCFISYSHADEDFAQRLHADLQAAGVRCWFAPEDMKTGDKLRDRIEESIRIYDQLLLILSEHSMASEWVAGEVETALEKEKRQNRTVLFPIRIDDAVMKARYDWAAKIKRERHITDMSQWKEHDTYQTRLQRLLRDLKEETKPT